MQASINRLPTLSRGVASFVRFVIVATGLFLPANVALAGNGAGYGGPDLNPAAVPVQSERGVSLEELRSNTRVCMMTGRGQFEPMIAKVLKRIYGQPVPVELSGSSGRYEYINAEKGWQVAYKCRVTVNSGLPQASCKEFFNLSSNLILELEALGDIPKVRLVTKLPFYQKQDPRPTSEVVLNKYGQRIIDRHLHFGVRAGPESDPWIGTFYNLDNHLAFTSHDTVIESSDYAPVFSDLVPTAVSFPYASALSCLLQQLQGDSQ
jgi:hypothetical protein